MSLHISAVSRCWFNICSLEFHFCWKKNWSFHFTKRYVADNMLSKSIPWDDKALSLMLLVERNSRFVFFEEVFNFLVNSDIHECRCQFGAMLNDFRFFGLSFILVSYLIHSLPFDFNLFLCSFLLSCNKCCFNSLANNSQHTFRILIFTSWFKSWCAGPLYERLSWKFVVICGVGGTIMILVASE